MITEPPRSAGPDPVPAPGHTSADQSVAETRHRSADPPRRRGLASAQDCAACGNAARRVPAGPAGDVRRRAAPRSTKAAAGMKVAPCCPAVPSPTPRSVPGNPSCSSTVSGTAVGPGTASMDALAVTHTVIAVDLPGHGESDAPGRRLLPRCPRHRGPRPPARPGPHVRHDRGPQPGRWRRPPVRLPVPAARRPAPADQQRWPRTRAQPTAARGDPARRGPGHRPGRPGAVSAHARAGADGVRRPRPPRPAGRPTARA